MNKIDFFIISVGIITGFLFFFQNVLFVIIESKKSKPHLSFIEVLAEVPINYFSFGVLDFGFFIPKKNTFSETIFRIVIKIYNIQLVALYTGLFLLFLLIGIYHFKK